MGEGVVTLTTTSLGMNFVLMESEALIRNRSLSSSLSLLMLLLSTMMKRVAEFGPRWLLWGSGSCRERAVEVGPVGWPPLPGPQQHVYSTCPAKGKN